MVRNHLSSLGAAEARSLIPLAVELAEGLTINVPGKVTLVAMKEAMGNLHRCYQLLSSEHRAEAEAGALRMHALAFHDLLVSLHQADPDKWLLRPKHHLFLEMAADGAQPSASWTYREESFGGSLSRMGRTNK